jgi:hypothetical protein
VRRSGSFLLAATLGGCGFANTQQWMVRQAESRDRGMPMVARNLLTEPNYRDADNRSRQPIGSGSRDIIWPD